MEEDVLSDVVPSNIVSRQVRTNFSSYSSVLESHNVDCRKVRAGKASTTRKPVVRWRLTSLKVTARR